MLHKMWNEMNNWLETARCLTRKKTRTSFPRQFLGATGAPRGYWSSQVARIYIFYLIKKKTPQTIRCQSNKMYHIVVTFFFFNFVRGKGWYSCPSEGTGPAESVFERLKSSFFLTSTEQRVDDTKNLHCIWWRP